jgi:hypothetical protein
VGSLVLNAYVVTGYQYCSEVPVREDGNIVENYSITRFILTDGEFEFNENGTINQFVNTDTNLWIELELAQEGQVEFTPGDYTLLDDCNDPYSVDNTAEVYARWYTNPTVEEYVYYYEQSGTVSVSKSGDTYSFTLDGTLIDYNDYNPPVAAKADGNSCEYYGSVDISGKFKGRFIEITNDIYRQWD